MALRLRRIGRGQVGAVAVGVTDGSSLMAGCCSARRGSRRLATAAATGGGVVAGASILGAGVDRARVRMRGQSKCFLRLMALRAEAYSAGSCTGAAFVLLGHAF